MVESAVQSHAEIVVDSDEKKLIRVLHVDDESALLRVTKQCLKLQGPFQVDTANSVEEALAKLQKEQYDAVVSDYQMRGKDGLEFLKTLRTKGNDIPFIILTGKGREEVAIKALNLGADRYLSKAGDPETVYCELAHAIRQSVDRRSIQIALLEREAKLNAILESSPEAITITDLDGNIVECNRATVDLHCAQSKEKLIGRNSLELIAKKSREKALQTLKKTIEQGSVKMAEYTLLTEDGREFPGELSASVVMDASGKPEYFVGISRDLTERKKAEEALRESEKKFRTLFDNANDALIYLDGSGSILAINRKTVEMFGGTRKELIGKQFTEIGIFSVKETSELTHNFASILAGNITNLNVPIKNKRGQQIDLECSIAFVKLDEAPAMVVVARDISERKKMEAELRRLATIVTDSNDAVTVVDMDGRITAWNKGAEETYGYRKDEALGMDIIEIVPEDKKQEILDVIGKIKNNEAVGSFETKRLAKDGRVLDIWLTITKLVDDKGNIVALAKTERDITEKKRLEERLRFSEKFTILGQLSSSVAHEIRNPLGVIKNSVYFLNVRLKEYADEKVAKHLRIMEENVNSADRIISDLLDLGRNKVGVLEPVDLNIILERAFASLSVPENIKVITKLNKIPKMLLDPERIQRVFVNIIQNAVAAMPKGGKLTVGLSRSGDLVKISFKDSGVGISEENMKKLFTPLFTTKTKGLGMGLAICRQIVEGHRGDIVVKSKTGEGALFTVSLPILSRAELVKAGLLHADVLTGGMSE